MLAVQLSTELGEDLVELGLAVVPAVRAESNCRHCARPDQVFEDGYRQEGAYAIGWRAGEHLQFEFAYPRDWRGCRKLGVGCGASWLHVRKVEGAEEEVLMWVVECVVV